MDLFDNSNAIKLINSMPASDVKQVIMSMPDEKIKEIFVKAFQNSLAIACNSRKVLTHGSSAMDELNHLIGLDETKEHIYKLISYYKIKQVALCRGRKWDEISNNIVFVGNPGTAKTTVARILSKILYENNMMMSGSKDPI